MTDFMKMQKRIFLVQQTMDLGTGEYTTDRSGGAYAQALKDGFPEVINTTRLSIGRRAFIIILPD